MKLWGIGFETNKNNIFIQIFKVIVTGCCWGWRCKFAKKIGLNKFLSQHREVLWWLLFSVWSLAQELCNQFLYETGRINHGTIHRINHALFLFSFPKDPLLAFGLSGPFIRQIREFPVTRVDTEEPMPVLVLNSFSTTKWSCDGTVQNVFPDPFTLTLLALNLNSFVLSWNLWDFGIFFPVNIVVIRSESSSDVIDFLLFYHTNARSLEELTATQLVGAAKRYTCRREPCLRYRGPVFSVTFNSSSSHRSHSGNWNSPQK